MTASRPTPGCQSQLCVQGISRSNSPLWDQCPVFSVTFDNFFVKGVSRHQYHTTFYLLGRAQMFFLSSRWCYNTFRNHLEKKKYCNTKRSLFTTLHQPFHICFTPQNFCSLHSLGTSRSLNIPHMKQVGQLSSSQDKLSIFQKGVHT